MQLSDVSLVPLHRYLQQTTGTSFRLQRCDLAGEQRCTREQCCACIRSSYQGLSAPLTAFRATIHSLPALTFTACLPRAAPRELQRTFPARHRASYSVTPRGRCTDFSSAFPAQQRGRDEDFSIAFPAQQRGRRNDFSIAFPAQQRGRCTDFSSAFPAQQRKRGKNLSIAFPAQQRGRYKDLAVPFLKDLALQNNRGTCCQHVINMFQTGYIFQHIIHIKDLAVPLQGFQGLSGAFTRTLRSYSYFTRT